mmetsp:Transcript_44978/g.136357  ORF Transcript_44978/g.136357 Transcript_44978/m.136357 type:complete len:87 (-) Transcript_44978:240-500(-)
MRSSKRVVAHHQPYYTSYCNRETAINASYCVVDASGWSLHGALSAKQIEHPVRCGTVWSPGSIHCHLHSCRSTCIKAGLQRSISQM